MGRQKVRIIVWGDVKEKQHWNHISKEMKTNESAMVNKIIHGVCGLVPEETRGYGLLGGFNSPFLLNLSGFEGKSYSFAWDR